MAVKIRLSRAGAKKTPHYRVIIADSRSPRDGRFLERVGTYNPLLPRDHQDRVKLKLDRIKYWLDQGAQPSPRVAKFLGSADVIPVPKRENPIKAKPKAKARARSDALAQAAAKKADEASKESAKPAEPTDETKVGGSSEAEKTDEAPKESAKPAEPTDETKVEGSSEGEKTDEASNASAKPTKPTDETLVDEGDQGSEAEAKNKTKTKT